MAIISLVYGILGLVKLWFFKEIADTQLFLCFCYSVISMFSYRDIINYFDKLKNPDIQK
ncbi:MAG: hypothetical protein ACP5OG_03410 [Candidatus Nanoarchaeia archaeon]